MFALTLNNFCRIYSEAIFTLKLQVNFTNKQQITHWIKHEILMWIDSDSIYFIYNFKENFYSVQENLRTIDVEISADIEKTRKIIRVVILGYKSEK